MQEKHVKEKQIEHQKEIIQMQEKLKSNLARQIKVSDNVMTLQDQDKKASQVSVAFVHVENGHLLHHHLRQDPYI